VWDVFHSGVGASLAVLHMEQAIAAGAGAFVACGGAGAVEPGMALGQVVVPTAAVRDEGTSFHYAPASHKDNWLPVPGDHRPDGFLPNNGWGLTVVRRSPSTGEFTQSAVGKDVLTERWSPLFHGWAVEIRQIGGRRDASEARRPSRGGDGSAHWGVIRPMKRTGTRLASDH
jgi:hypothetical protein